MTELLSPAGNWDCARAAVANGADAIFFGLPRFNARMRADNFTEEDLPELMDFLHRHGVKGFVAFNTLVFPNELKGAVEQIELMGRAGVDAVIVQDLGAAKLVKEIAPEMEVHASTQMTITSPEGLAFIDELIGLERAVLARELSVEEIARINQKNDVPLEVFVHGALCVAYSGQCLTSESLGQRSANRGECAQACRMPYELVVDGETKEMGEVRYLLSPQDLSAVDHIPDLVKAGVVSFKIEGRLKSPEYVAAVTKVYRKALDDVEILPDDRHTLEMMFSRGLSSGWLGGTNHPKLTHGKWGKKRGAYVGKLTAKGEGWIEIDSSEVPIESGNGFVIDAGEDRNNEQGGMVWKIENNRLDFDRRAKIDWDRVTVGSGLWKTSDPKLDAAVRKTWKGGRLREKGDALEITAYGKVGEPLRLACRGKQVASEIPLAAAEKRPLGKEVLEAQLGRLGGTNFSLGSVKSEIEGEVILPLGELNRCRRKLVDAITIAPEVRDGAAILNDLMPVVIPIEDEVEVRVLCRSLAQVRGAIMAGAKFLYCDFEDLRLYKDAVAVVRETSDEIVIFLATPRIQKPSEAGYFKLIQKAEPDGVLVRNLGAIEFFRNSAEESKLRLIGDFSLNVSNALTASLLIKQGGFENLTISYDLNEGQVGDLLAQTPSRWLELTVHQHMPMFHMEHCVFCTFMSEGTSIKDCGKPCDKHKVQLRDRVGQLHTLSADVGCRNTLFNGLAQTGVGSVEGFLKKGLRRFRLELLEEDEHDTERLVKVYLLFFAKERTARDVSSQLGAIERLGVTKGTLEQKREEVHR